jgi:hypothetical protein
MPIIIFWDNESGRVFAFKDKHEAAHHVESDFVSDFLRKDSDNVVLAGLADPVKPIIVKDMIVKNQIGMSPLETVFIDNKLNLSDVKEVFPNDVLDETKYYYRVKKLIGRMGEGEPDTTTTMIAKIQALNLTRRKKSNEPQPKPINRALGRKERNVWTKITQPGQEPQKFELLGDRDEKMLAQITKIRNGFQIEKWMVRKGSKPELVVKEIYPTWEKAHAIGLHGTKNILAAKKTKHSRANLDYDKMEKMYGPFKDIVKKNFNENKQRLREPPFDIRSADELQSDVEFEFLMKYSPAARASYVKNKSWEGIGIYPALYAGGFTLADLEKFLLTEYVKIAMKQPRTIETIWAEIYPQRKKKNLSVTESQIKDEEILSAIENPKQEKLSDEKNKDLYHWFAEGNLGIPRADPVTGEPNMPQLELDDELADRRGSLSRRFLDYLISTGVNIADDYVNVHDLKPTQKEIYGKQVRTKLTTLKYVEGKMDDFTRTELPVIKRELDGIKDMEALKTKFKNEYKNKVFQGGSSEEVLAKAKKKLLLHLSQLYMNYLLKIVTPIIVSRDYHIIDGHHRWAALVAWDFKDRVDIPIMIHVKVVDMDTEPLIEIAKKFSKP